MNKLIFSCLALIAFVLPFSTFAQTTPTVSFVQDKVQVREGSTAYLQVTLDQSITETTKVTVKLTPDKGTARQDLRLRDTITLTFSAGGPTTQSIAVRTLRTAAEGNKGLTATITKVGDTTIPTAQADTARVTVLDQKAIVASINTIKPASIVVSKDISVLNCVALTANLEVRSTDEAGGVGPVRKLQDFLYQFRYLSETPTGYFGPLTKAALIKFQTEYNIKPAEGYVGAITRAKIKELTCGGISPTFAIQSISPSIAKVGQTVALSGPGLNSGGDYILFDGYRIETDGSKALNRVAFVVPEYLSFTINCIKAPCPDALVRSVTPGAYTVQVVNTLGTSNKVILTVTDSSSVPPVDTVKISWVEPSATKVGAEVTLYGYNLFESETRVLFDGMVIPATPIYVKRAGKFDSALEFVVPEFISPPCNRLKPTDPCPLGMVRQVVPGTYEIEVDNKYGRDSVKFEVLGDVVVGKPVIIKTRPSIGPIKTRVLIDGKNINSGTEKIYFGGSLVTPISNANTDRKGVIYFDVPEYITPCGVDSTGICDITSKPVIPGNYDIVVKNAAGLSNNRQFTVTGSGTTVAPKIDSLAPSAGVVGTEVVIKGRGINVSRDQIYFGGSLIPAALINSSASDDVNTLRFKVPAVITPCGVGSTGSCDIASKPVVPGTYNVVVVNRNGTSNPSNFTVIAISTNPAPVISNLVPQSGVVGTRVTVSGSNINTNAEYVLFRGFRIETVGPKVTNKVSFIVPSTLSNPCVPSPSGLCPPGAEIQVTPGAYSVAIGNANGVSNAVTFNVISYSVESPLISKFQAEDVTTGGSVSRRLVWTTQFASSCTASGAWSGTQPVNGSYSIGFMSQPLTYTLTCVNSLGVSVSRSIIAPTAAVQQTPVIASISPSSVSIGKQITLTGERLNTGSAKVIFGDGYITPDPTRSSDSVLVFTVPSSISRYCSPSSERVCTDDMISVSSGSYSVRVVNSFGTSNAKTVTVVEKNNTNPVISNINPTSGGTGVDVSIGGSNLNSASDYVWFGGKKLEPNRYMKSLNTLVFTVPQTLFECDAKSEQECLAIYQPTPLGAYQVKVENSAGKISNAINYQVTSNGSSLTF